MPKVKKIILVILILLLNIPIVYAPSEYGEDSTALGQFVDDFENDGNVSVAYQVINNVTTDVMELNYTGIAGGSQENLLTWTEVDVEGDLVVTSTTVTYSSLRRDSDATIYKDFGLDYFEDFMFNLTFSPTSMEAGDASNIASFWLMSLSTHNTRDGMVTDDSFIIEMRQLGATDNKHAYRTLQFVNGVNAWSINDPTFYNTPFTHYISLYRSGTTIGVIVYSDEARTNILEHLTTGSGGQETYQYANLAIGYSSTGDPADHASGSVTKVDLGISSGGGYYDNGYFTTTNYLNDTNANGSTLALQTISKIPTDTEIKVQFSNDNSTWGNNLGVVGLGNILISGLYTIDMRDLNYTVAYLRYNESTSDNTITPFLNQSKIITTIGVGGVVSGSSYPFLMPIVITILLISTLSIFFIKGGKRK